MCFRIAENTGRQRFMCREKMLDVSLEFDFGMHLCPIVRRPNNCQKQEHVLKALADQLLGDVMSTRDARVPELHHSAPVHH